MPILQVIIASTRKGRQGVPVADWCIEGAKRHGEFTVERIDLQEVNLPLLDEPNHPRLQKYEFEHTRRWSEIVTRADAFVIVTPEYDFGPPASILNALQFLANEWQYKPVGMVSYGGVSAGTRSAQGLRGIAAALKMAPIPEGVSIPFFSQYIDKATGVFAPGEVQDKANIAMLDELLRWTNALAVLRTK